MQKRNKTLLIILGAVVVVAVIVANFMTGSVKATDVNADLVERQDITEMVSASGRIEPKTKVDITSEVAGEIIGLFVKEGDRVETGELLVVIDTIQLRSYVDQAYYALAQIDATLEGSKVALDKAEADFEREKKIHEQGHSSDAVYDAYKYTYENAKAVYQAQKAQSRQLKAAHEQQLDYLKRAKISAPMSGIITYLDCEIGEIAAPQTQYSQGKTLMTISDLDIFEVEVEVDETEINKVEVGQKADIEVDAFPDTSFGGAVVEVGNTAVTSLTSTQATNFRVKVVFQDPNVKLRPGMSATVDITTAERNGVLTIPYSSVVMRSFDLDSLAEARRHAAESSGTVGEVHAAEAGGNEPESTMSEDDGEREELKGVFAVRDGSARFVEIETGIADQKRIEIIGGLTEGDTVIAGPYRVLRNVKDGDALKAEFKDN